MPKVARIAVLFQTKNPRNMFEFKEVLPASAGALGLTLLRTEVRDARISSAHSLPSTRTAPTDSPCLAAH